MKYIQDAAHVRPKKPEVQSQMKADPSKVVRHVAPF